MKTKRYNEWKIDWTLIDFESIQPLVEILEFWAKKYSRDNWKLWGEKMKREEILKSLMRHVIAYQQGEDIDEESWCKHIGCMMANLMFLEYHTNICKKEDKEV